MEARNQETLRPNPAALMSRQRRDDDEDDDSGDGSDEEVEKLLNKYESVFIDIWVIIVGSGGKRATEKVCRSENQFSSLLGG